LPEVDPYARLVTDDLGVVARWNRRDLAGADLVLGAVVHHDAHPPGDAVAEVRYLAGVGSGDRLEVRRPLPPGFEDAARHGMARDDGYVGVSLPFERACLVRRVKALDLDCGGATNFSHGSSSRSPDVATLRYPFPCAYPCSPPKSTSTHGSSPSTQASWPG